MIPPNILARLVGSRETTDALCDLVAMYGESVLDSSHVKNIVFGSKEPSMPISGTQFCDICMGYGFWQDDPHIPIMYSERYDAPSVPCVRCDSDNDYFGEGPTSQVMEVNRSISEILNRFRE